MRAAFDNTLPVADGLMEIGTHVPVAELKGAMEDWFRRKSYIAKDASLVLTGKPKSLNHQLTNVRLWKRSLAYACAEPRGLSFVF